MQESKIQYAGFWRRFAALLIDQILLFTCGFALIVAMEAPFALYLFVVGIFVYDIGFHCRFGATIGQHLLRIKVIDKSGGHPSLVKNIGRFFARILSGIPFYYGYIRSLWDSHRQTWHDELAGTYVVHSKSPGLANLTTQKDLPPAKRLKLLRPMTLLYFVAGLSLILFLSQLLLKSSESAAFAQKEIVSDPVVVEICGPNPTVTFRYGNPFSIFTKLGIGNIYFNVEGDSGSVLARSQVYSSVYSFDGNLGARVELDQSDLGYEITATVGRRLCFPLAKRGIALLSNGDSLFAYKLFRRALSINYDYTHSIEFRLLVESDTSYAVETIDWNTSELSRDHIYLYPEGYKRTSIDAELEKSYLIRVLLERGYCYNVIGEPSKAVADFNSLLEHFPWMFPIYLDKSSAFIQMKNFDSASYYLNAYVAVEPDSNSQEFNYATAIRSRLLSLE